jgi:hypothetical protein
MGGGGRTRRPPFGSVANASSAHTTSTPVRTGVYVIAASLIILKALAMSWLNVVRMMQING